MSSEQPDIPPLLTDDESEDEELPDIYHNPIWLSEIQERESNDMEAIPGPSRYFQDLYSYKVYKLLLT